MYNLTNITDANNIYETVVAVNQLSNGIFGLILIASVFLILFFSLKTEDTENAFISSSFITTILSIIMVFINLSSWYMVMLPLVIFIGSIIYKLFRGD
jgi:hypothetical protein